ncbi:glycosyltransferase [Pelistega suis]|uniref:Glycosyltransferase n=1 Tax=Pelistega suis TaxID=1631957 RepID=A0A849P775_9BURK|nr:glycosyltransferase [Pelistega suis]NOL51615.1 glycosyltransferase [Pelistega suis]
MSTICLNMIVKNESHIIEKTLENLCQHLTFDYWVISDTGSTDNTVTLIEQFFKQRQIPGEIYHAEWKNFAYNRNLALQAATKKTDYVLFFDADDSLHGEVIIPESLNQDAYFFKFGAQTSGTAYQRLLLVRNDGSFYWRGVLHEFIERRIPASHGLIDGDYYVISGRLGDRNKNPQQKYINDARLLEQACFDNQEPDLLPRYMFYCAQSFRDAGLSEKALEWYTKRAQFAEGWVDERYLSYLAVGFIYEGREDYEAAQQAWLQAVCLCPERAEAWYHLARRCNWQGHYTLAYTYARQGCEYAFPTNSRLFLSVDIYRYWRYYEYCLNAALLQKWEESYQGFKQLVEYAPADLIMRLEVYLPHYREFLMKDNFEQVSQLQQMLEIKGLTSFFMLLLGK